MAEADKPPYGSIPLHWPRDSRVKLTHMRVGIQIAYHDRRSLPRGEGEGCYAGIGGIAEALSMDPSNVRKAVKDLVDWGYVVSTKEPGRRAHILRIVYPATGCHHTPLDDPAECSRKGATTPPKGVPPHLETRCHGTSERIRTEDLKDSVETDARGRAPANDDPGSWFDDYPDLPSLIERAIEILGPRSQGALAFRAGVAPNEMSYAKAGKATTEICRDRIAAECWRLIEAEEACEPIEAMPELPLGLLHHLPDRFALRKRPSQVKLIRRAYDRSNREGRLDDADRAAIVARLTFAARREPTNQDVREASDLARRIAKGEPEYDLAYR